MRFPAASLSDPGLRRDRIPMRTEAVGRRGGIPTLRHSTGYITHTWSQWRRFAAAVLLPGSRHASSGSSAAAAASAAAARAVRAGERALLVRETRAGHATCTQHPREMTEREELSTKWLAAVHGRERGNTDLPPPRERGERTG